MTPDELRLWRKGRGLTQRQLAALVNVRRETVTNWEKGHHDIPFDVLAKLEAHSPSIKAAQPLMDKVWRIRPYIWANRDYDEDKEWHKIPVGGKVWRLFLDERKTNWEVRVMLSDKRGHTLHSSEPRITLPPEAFPDPLGPEAPWARAMYAERLAAYNAEISGLRQAMRDSGIPPEE